MQSVVFEVRNTDRHEYTVWAKVPAAGGDSSLIAVYNSKLAADSLARVLNHAASLYPSA